MTEVIAGAVDGLLALLGLLVQQVFARRYTRRDAMRLGATELLVELEKLVFSVGRARERYLRDTSSDSTDEPLQWHEAMQPVSRLAIGMTLTADDKTVSAVTEVKKTAFGLTAAVRAPNEEAFTAATNRYFEARSAFIRAVRRDADW